MVWLTDVTERELFLLLVCTFVSSSSGILWVVLPVFSATMPLWYMQPDAEAVYLPIHSNAIQILLQYHRKFEKHISVMLSHLWINNCSTFPKMLFSLDGSEFAVWFDNLKQKKGNKNDKDMCLSGWSHSQPQKRCLYEIMEVAISMLWELRRIHVDENCCIYTPYPFYWCSSWSGT